MGSKRARDRQSNAAQRLNSSNDVDTGKSKAVMTTEKSFAFTSDNTSIPIPFRTASITPAITSMNKSTSTSSVVTSTEYDTGTTIFKTSTTTPTTIISTSSDTPTTSTLTTATTVTTTTITHTVKEATSTTDWISQDSVAVGITV